MTTEEVTQRINTYIANTGMEETYRYDILREELYALCRIQPIYQPVLMAFRYGQCKGYRQAKAEAKNAST